MSVVTVIAPHPDDETLGCGGTLLRHLYEGDEVHWIIITQISESMGYSREKLDARRAEVAKVAKSYGFNSYTWFEYQAATLSPSMLGELISKLGKAIELIKPDIIYAPYPGDIHSDHGVVFDAVSACSKSFRYPFIKKVCCYETLSETEFSINPLHAAFKPNLFVDVSNFFEKKVEIMNHYEGEVKSPPFPRSEEGLRSLARYRGAIAGCELAEAYIVIKEII